MAKGSRKRGGSLLDVGEAQGGIIIRSGTWYSYGDLRLGQGKENCRQFLKSNPELAAEIEVKVRESVGLPLAGGSPASGSGGAASDAKDGGKDADGSGKKDGQRKSKLMERAVGGWISQASPGNLASQETNTPGREIIRPVFALAFGFRRERVLQSRS